MPVRVLRSDPRGLAEEREDGRDQRARRRPEDGWSVGDAGGRGWHLRGSVRPLRTPPDRLRSILLFRRFAFGKGAEIIEPASRVRLAHGDEVERVLFGDVLGRKDVRAACDAGIPNANPACDAHPLMNAIPVAPLLCRFDTDGRPFFEFEHGR